MKRLTKDIPFGDREGGGDGCWWHFCQWFFLWLPLPLSCSVPALPSHTHTHTLPVTLQPPVAGKGVGGMAGADPSGCELLHLLWRCSLLVQPSHPYMTTRKTIALTRRTFISKVMSLLFNTLSRLVIALLPRSKRLLGSRLQSPSAVILEPKKMKSGRELESLLLNHYTPLLATLNIATRAICRH